jgi:hypothetical protein
LTETYRECMDSFREEGGGEEEEGKEGEGEEGG